MCSINDCHLVSLEKAYEEEWHADCYHADPNFLKIIKKIPHTDSVLQELESADFLCNLIHFNFFC